MFLKWFENFVNYQRSKIEVQKLEVAALFESFVNYQSGSEGKRIPMVEMRFNYKSMENRVIQNLIIVSAQVVETF